ILAVLAACCNGKSILTGTHRLVYKESNRIQSIEYLLQQLNVSITIRANQIEIIGNNSISGGIIDSCNDHRIAMAAAILALVAQEAITIQNASVVNKSYPNFWSDLKIISNQPTTQ